MYSRGCESERHHLSLTETTIPCASSSSRTNLGSSCLPSVVAIVLAIVTSLLFRECVIFDSILLLPSIVTFLLFLLQECDFDQKLLPLWTYLWEFNITDCSGQECGFRCNLLPFWTCLWECNISDCSCQECEVFTFVVALLDGCCIVWWAVSMHLQLVCVIACISLHLAVCGRQWEVINDVKPYDDSGTQEQLLSQEDLIPFKVNKPKPKPKPRPAVAKPALHKNAENRNTQQMTQAPLPRPNFMVNGGGSEVVDEELLPLGVPRHSNQRHLLQLDPVQGPTLPQEAELRRLRLRSRAVNLSTACKEDDDEDCLFDVDDFVARQRAKVDHFEQQLTESEVLEQESEGRDSGFEDLLTISRHRRQVDTNETPEEEGSGTFPPDTLYSNITDYPYSGLYEVNSTIGVQHPNASTITTLSPEEKDNYSKEFKKQLEKLFNDTLPGFVGVVVGEPELQNGTVVSPYTVRIDGGEAYNKINETNVEQGFLSALNNATIPGLLNLTIFQTLVDPLFTLTDQFVSDLKTILGNYCNSRDPCPDAGPEYNVTACMNTGFLSGHCPHKCSSFPCQNNAICELDLNYDPFCNCGDRYEGTYCETERDPGDTGLTTGETVGVGVASAAAALALLSCCVYLVCFRRRNLNVNYSYYEDEGAEEQLSDPTSIANYYIDRPIFSPTPIPVFNTGGGFDA